MTSERSVESFEDNSEQPSPLQNLESLDDISRDIADQRLSATYSDVIPPERMDVLHEHPDRIETRDQFDRAAVEAGILDTDGVLGWSTDLESPAHVLKGDVAEEISTLVHEDLHRLTAPETMAQMTASPELRDLYEGVTEFLTEKAVDDLHEHQAGRCYPEEVELAGTLAEDVGEPALEKFYFEHDFADEVGAAIDRLTQSEPSV
jgi:hypothetical protein